MAEPVDLTGLLTRAGGGFVLEADDGRRYRLELHRVPVDEAEKRVRVRGLLIAADAIDVDGVMLA